jgi:hypothetical protein
MANFQQTNRKKKQLKPEKISKQLFKFIEVIEKQILDKNRANL